MAEVLWSGAAPRTVPQTPAVESRLARFRCFMVQQFGIAASPVQPDFCNGVDGLLEGPRNNDNDNKNPLGYVEQPIAHSTTTKSGLTGLVIGPVPAWTILLVAVFVSAAFGYAAHGLRRYHCCLTAGRYSGLGVVAESEDNAELELTSQEESDGVYS